MPFKVFYKKCRRSETNLVLMSLRFFWYRIVHGKTLLMHQKVKLKGVRNIEGRERLEVGIAYVGFMHRKDRTLLNIKGKLKFLGEYSIGRGCRFDIGDDAVVTIGNDGYMNCNTSVFIMHRLDIGDKCVISWDCQFLDEDFHEISYEGKKEQENAIIIGNDVWIGCGVKIYKGTVIPDGCVVAADSVVRGVFTEKNALIGGFPAKVIRENISWE